MPLFTHIETGFAVDLLEAENEERYRSRFAVDCREGWVVAEAPDGTLPGASYSQGAFTNPTPATPAQPQPNTSNNPYFGKKPLETKDFYALVGQILSAARFKRLLTDSHFLWVGKVLDHVDHVDPDDKAGQFLQITTYLQTTNAEDGQKLITAQEVAAIMAAWA